MNVATMSRSTKRAYLRLRHEKRRKINSGGKGSKKEDSNVLLLQSYDINST